MKETPQWRLIRQWYEHVRLGAQPSPQELQQYFRSYADQAEILVRRVKDGQPWDDFVMGLDGAPKLLRRYLTRHVADSRN